MQGSIDCGPALLTSFHVSFIVLFVCFLSFFRPLDLLLCVLCFFHVLLKMASLQQGGGSSPAPPIDPSCLRLSVLWPLDCRMVSDPIILYIYIYIYVCESYVEPCPSGVLDCPQSPLSLDTEPLVSPRCKCLCPPTTALRRRVIERSSTINGQITYIKNLYVFFSCPSFLTHRSLFLRSALSFKVDSSS